MKKNLRAFLYSVIFLFIVSLLLPTGDSVGRRFEAAQGDDQLRRLYENDELFEQLSGAARTLLELKFGKKAAREAEQEPILSEPRVAPDEAAEQPLDNVLVNDPNLDLTAQDTQSETTLVLGSGSNIVVGYNDSGSCLPSCGVTTTKFTGFSRSTNEGASFTDQGSLPTSANGDAGDPVLARDNVSGRIYFATLFFSGAGIQVFRSDNDGATFGPPVNGAPGKIGFQDKEWITVDNFSGPGQGNVYHVARDFGPGNGIFFFRSTDAGDTFSPNGGTLIASGSPVNVQGAFVTVGPDHAVYVFWFEQTSPQRIMMRKSTDQGVTFGAPVNVATLSTTGVNGNLGLTGIRDGTTSPAGFRSNAFPHATVNPVNGNIYVVYNDNPAGTDKADVFFRHSTNGGATWSAAVRVNDDSTTTDQWQPTLAVTPDGTRLGFFWYDRRLDPENNLIDTFGVICNINGAVTCGPNFRITDQSFPPEFGRDPVVNAVYMGDYDQAVADNNFFYYTWGDNRLPNPNFPPRIRQADVRFTKIPVSPVSDVALTASPASVPAGGMVTGTWSNLLSATATDWIGVFADGAPDSAYLNWVYAGSCSQTPGSLPPASGSCPLV
ncbi:MAG: sialidase family protein, partial [Nitrososphaera sp.]